LLANAVCPIRQLMCMIIDITVYFKERLPFGFVIVFPICQTYVQAQPSHIRHYLNYLDNFLPRNLYAHTLSPASCFLNLLGSLCCRTSTYPERCSSLSFLS